MQCRHQVSIFVLTVVWMHTNYELAILKLANISGNRPNKEFMHSDIIIVEFVDKLGHFKSKEIQQYLDGVNQWKTPICEKDIVNIEYSFSHALNGNNKSMISGVLLIHRIPA